MEKYLIDGKFYSYKELNKLVKSLTPPNKDEINEMIYSFMHKISVMFSIDDIEAVKIIVGKRGYILYWYNEDSNKEYELKISKENGRKITSYFMSLEE